MSERVSFFIGERIDCFDGCEFGGGELSEALFGFNWLFLDNFYVFV